MSLFRRRPAQPAPPDLPGHERCAYVEGVLNRTITDLRAELEKERERHRREIDDLHEKLVEMHGFGHDELRRAQQFKKELGHLATELRRKGVAETTLEEEVEKAVRVETEAQAQPQPAEFIEGPLDAQ